MTSLLPGERIAITVTGIPVPQGSKQSNPYGRGVRDSNADTLHPWRRHVTATARDQARYAAKLTGPVLVRLRFTFDRPKSHYGTGRNVDRILPSAPGFPGHGCGDLDKLERAILDALTDAGVWNDDSQVVQMRSYKFYAGEHELARRAAGVDIILEELT